MVSISLSKEIKASRERVWEAIVDPDLYVRWAEAFHPGSDFEGAWVQGSPIQFFSLDEQGRKQGMISEIAECRYPEFISIRTVGLLQDGVADCESPDAQTWKPAYENYTLVPLADGHTRFELEMQVPGDFEEEFTTLWVQALDKLTSLLEPDDGGASWICLRQAVRRSPETVWACLTDPDQVRGWNFADPSWHCPSAMNTLQVGGEFHYEMAAVDGSFRFDFWGTYQTVDPPHRLHFVLGDGRAVRIDIHPTPEGVVVEERFQAEQMNSLDMQRQGWAAILARMAAYAEQMA